MGRVEVNRLGPVLSVDVVDTHSSEDTGSMPDHAIREIGEAEQVHGWRLGENLEMIPIRFGWIIPVCSP